MLTAMILDDDKELGKFELKPKSFIAGAGGYASKSKVEIDGKTYSVTLSLIEIGST
jgi:hypothetical protein